MGTHWSEDMTNSIFFVNQNQNWRVQTPSQQPVWAPCRLLGTRPARVTRVHAPTVLVPKYADLTPPTRAGGHDDVSYVKLPQIRM